MSNQVRVVSSRLLVNANSTIINDIIIKLICLSRNGRKFLDTTWPVGTEDAWDTAAPLGKT